MEIGTQNLPPFPLGKISGKRKYRSGGINESLNGSFFNASDPIFYVQQEKPVHRMMTDMYAAGATFREIAAATGYDDRYIGQVVRQPYAQQRIIKTLEKNVTDELKQMLEKATPDCLQEVIRLGKAASSEQVRLAANNSVIDRFLGRATQPISTEVTDPKNLTNDELGRKVQEALARVPTTARDSKESDGVEPLQ